jgi:hypothetical protein
VTDSLVIPPRFCGPPDSGNGGYVCGSIAAYLDSPVTVTLRRPPPLATPMAVDRDDAGAIRILADGVLIADAMPAPDRPELGLPSPVSLAEAHAAAGGGRYYADPFFPQCFVCGPGRSPGDGLRIFAGPLAGRPVWAAPWIPDQSVAEASGTVRPEMVWAALDCPSGIAAAEAADLASDTGVLLGRMTASLAALPAAGDECRVIAWPERQDGRKLTARSALVGPGGDILAAATAVWLTVPLPVG